MATKADVDQQRAAFEAWARKRWPDIGLSQYASGAYLVTTVEYAWEAWQVALESPEVQALRDALEKCRFALEPYDDIKPRDWVTDRQNLRRAHEAARAALAAMENQK